MHIKFRTIAATLLTVVSAQVISKEQQLTSAAINLICGHTVTPINQIQGDGDESPLVGKMVEVEGVVTADFQTGLQGFYLQALKGTEDKNPDTSEGIFVFTENQQIALKQGNHLRLQAKVEEHQGLTRLSSITTIKTCAESAALPEPINLKLPFTKQPEALEGMRVSFDALTINDVYTLGRFGTVTLANGRRYIPTQVATPGAAARALTEQNALNKILLDDGSNQQNPESVRYPTGGLSAQNTLRVGDTLNLASGVMHYNSGDYRVHPTSEANIIKSNPRPKAPALSEHGNLKVASFNVLNYFTTLDERGADSKAEFSRQQAKTVAALTALDADVIGLMEVQNNGFDEQSALANLVSALHSASSANDWRFVTPEVKQIGTDAIMVAIVYRESVATPVNAAAILDSANSAKDADGKPLYLDDKNRPTLAQEFRHNATGDNFVLSVSHLKSKGSNCNSLGDPDLNDGQGNCNLTRTRAAKAIANWLNAEFADKAIVSVGDFNAYAKEDPLTALAAGGFVELFEHLNKTDAYSYVYAGQSGQLDHALANNAMLNKVVDVTEWHINTDEPIILDYNMEHKSEAQIEAYYAADPYRSSDHDPVVIALQMGREDN